MKKFELIPNNLYRLGYKFHESHSINDIVLLQVDLKKLEIGLDKISLQKDIVKFLGSFYIVRPTGLWGQHLNVFCNCKLQTFAFYHIYDEQHLVKIS